MKLIVRIGTDLHLELLPHFLEHYSRIGVDSFLCGLHGQHQDEARMLLARYPSEIVVDFGAEPFSGELNNQWTERFNQVRLQYARPGEWCLFADVDEFHEYPPDFFASLDPHINAVRGWWVERLATSDGQLLPCLPDKNIGQQFPFGTQEIFCGISQKVMAVRGDLDLMIGYHAVTGGSDKPVFHKDYLRVHHFRWNDRTAVKYANRSWTSHYELEQGYVPGLTGVSYVNPPFPPVGSWSGGHPPKISVILPVQNATSRIGAVIQSIRAQTFTDWELIIVDSDSTGDTNGIVASCVNGDERIRVIVGNGPLTAARHTGFMSARGGYIYCLDENHLSLPDTLQRLSDCLDTQMEAALAYGVLDSLKPLSSLDAFKQLGTENFLNAGAVAMRRSALSTALADSDFDSGDSSLWWSLLSQGTAAFVEGKALSITRALPTVCSTVSNGAGAPGTKDAPVKLAYLIIAHRQPAHLGRLVRALDQQDNYFFIYVDAKADLPSFQAMVPQLDNVSFVADRVRVEWGKFSVVQAALNLIQAAVASGHLFRYYTLLSGSDYPVKHRQAIRARLLSSDCQYLRIESRLTDPKSTHGYLLKDLPDGRYFDDVVPYHGSMYWSLTAGCIRFILDFISANPGYLGLHRHVGIPDEVFFHSLVKHSPFADAITHDFSAVPCPDYTHHGNHFIDWQGLRKRDYLTLDERDLNDLLGSDALFARKFDECKSSKLLDLLDVYVHDCDFQQEPLEPTTAQLESYYSDASR